MAVVSSGLKARLVREGRVRLAENARWPYYPTTGASGPHAGDRSIFFEVQGHLVKLALVKDDDCRLELLQGADGWTLTGLPGYPPVSVRPIKARFHAPGMAFFDLGEGCSLGCAFCVAQEGPGRGRRTRSVADWMRLVDEALEAEPGSAVAFTAGIGEGQDERSVIASMARVVAGVRKKHPGVPLGVEPYVTTREGVAALKEAGADEIKINVETATLAVFRKVCPALDRDGLLRALAAAVGVFGKGAVCSNIIVGIGEDEDAIRDTVERLAGMGVAATLRAIRVNEGNAARLEAVLGRLPPPLDASDLERLARMQSEILARHGLDTSTFRTMCHHCTACDVVPGRDL